MIIFPAIDIKEGKVIRLFKGDFSKVTEYAQDPLEMAKHWKNQGAQYLHLVDLDGAKTGIQENQKIIIEIAQTVGIPVQVGGGIRSEHVVEELLNGGVLRVILGTRAVTDVDFCKKLFDTYGDRIAVSVDCKNGFVAERGWVDTSNVRGIDLAQKLEGLGLQCLIFTDIDTDGALSGPNIAALEEMLSVVKIPVIASGGISKLEDIKQLKKLEASGLLGVITGRAIYEQTLDLQEAIAAC